MRKKITAPNTPKTRIPDASISGSTNVGYSQANYGALLESLASSKGQVREGTCRERVYPPVSEEVSQALSSWLIIRPD